MSQFCRYLHSLRLVLQYRQTTWPILLSFTYQFFFLCCLDVYDSSFYFIALSRVVVHAIRCCLWKDAFVLHNVSRLILCVGIKIMLLGISSRVCRFSSKCKLVCISSC
jgi:hypothetical protein